MRIRDEQPADASQVRMLLDAAFPDEPVGQLVDDLRDAGDLTISLVAEQEGVIVGQSAFSPVAMAPGLVRVLQLSPLAVAEPCRRQGVGAGLVRAGIERCQSHGVSAILVLGNPAYYGRFGFDPAAATHLRSRWSGPYLMALLLQEGALDDCTFFALAPAFESLP